MSDTLESTMSLFFEDDEDGQYKMPTKEEREKARKQLEVEAAERNAELDMRFWFDAQEE